MATSKKPLVPPKLVPSDERTVMHMPKTSLTYQILAGTKNNIKMPKWKLLDALLELRIKTQEDKNIEIFENFCNQLENNNPGKSDAIRKIKNLRALILWYYIENEEVSDVYFEKLK